MIHDEHSEKKYSMNHWNHHDMFFEIPNSKMNSEVISMPNLKSGVVKLIFVNLNFEIMFLIFYDTFS